MINWLNGNLELVEREYTKLRKWVSGYGVSIVPLLLLYFEYILELYRECCAFFISFVTKNNYAAIHWHHQDNFNDNCLVMKTLISNIVHITCFWNFWNSLHQLLSKSTIGKPYNIKVCESEQKKTKQTNKQTKKQKNKNKNKLKTKTQRA